MNTGTAVKDGVYVKPGQGLHFSPSAFKARLLYDLKESHGFVTDTMLKELEQVEEWRLRLVRCGCGRFLCAVQDAKHFISIIEDQAKHGTPNGVLSGEVANDYIRDVSLPVGRFDIWPELGRKEE